MNEFLILFILKIKESNIYEIKKFIDKNFSPFMQISSGAIIPALNRLEKDKYIKSEKQISQGGLRKSFYSILPYGEELFNKLLIEPVDGAPQLVRREIEILLMLKNSSVFTDEQRELLIVKIKNAIADNSAILKKAIANKIMNVEYLQLELDYMEQKLKNLL